MRRIRFSIALALAIAPAATASAGDVDRRPVASRREAFPNPTDRGTRELAATVWYPTAKAGSVAPARDRPAIVFLPGRGGVAAAYSALGRDLAERGFVAVLSDTALFDPSQQVADGAALHAALAIANRDARSFWRGALDLSAIGLAGHSMGGGSAAHILAKNPGYKAGFAFAPWQGGVPFSADASAIDVPFGIVHGAGDRTLAWERTGKRLFDALPQDLPERFLYLLDGDATHLNIAIRTPFAGRADREIYATCADLCAAFFAEHLGGARGAVDAALARDDPRRLRLFRGDGVRPAAPAPTLPRRYY